MKYNVAAFGALLSVLSLPLAAEAQVFEVIHPEATKGGFELEILSGVVLDDVDQGDERTAYEFALSYSPTNFWKTTLALEIVNTNGENGEVEGFEFENILLLPFGNRHNDDHASSFGIESVGLYFALEVPDEGGIDSGALEIGPLVEISLGRLETVTNVFLEIPFEGEENEAVSYAFQARYPVYKKFSAGFEAYGEFENAFEGNTEDEHFIGPALFTEFDLGNGRVLEPRLAVLFGLNEDTPDATASLNLELKF